MARVEQLIQRVSSLRPIEIIWADFGPRKLNGIYGLSSSGFSYHSGFLFHFLAFSIISSHKFNWHEKREREKLFQIGFGFSQLLSAKSKAAQSSRKKGLGFCLDRFMPFFDHSFDHCGVVIVPCVSFSKGLISIPLFGGWTSLLGSLLSLVLDFFLLCWSWSHGCSVEDTYE